MTDITKKALRGNPIVLPNSGQEKPCLDDFDLWQWHLKKVYGLPSTFASAYSSIFELEGLRNAR
jgi:hypothetical protein